MIGSHVLLAVGRRPNTDDLGLEAAGVERDGQGYIVVDEELRTSVPHIWALGDCNGRGVFTHTSYNDYEIVAANLLDGAERKVTDRIPVYALYVDPPLGRVGMTETEARAKGHAVRVGRRPMTRVARAVEKGESQGFMKVVVDRDSGAILGAAILGVGGDEAIHARDRGDGRRRRRRRLHPRRRHPSDRVRTPADGVRRAVAVAKGGRESGFLAALTTWLRPVSRPVFARLLFPCSAPKSPDKSLFWSLLIPCSAPARARNRRVVIPARR